MVEAFVKTGAPGRLHLCGFGKQSGEIQALAAQHPQLQFDGLLPKQSDCLDWAQKVDVLVNPRLNIWGLENSFPSKIFEFSMTGKAILTTPTGGVDRVLGDRAFYLDADRFEASFAAQVKAISGMDRAVLRERGRSIRQHVMAEYTWDRQAARMTEFMEALVDGRSIPGPA
jgi:glycosyltransferase involved in cell wall biosynthesis